MVWMKVSTLVKGLLCRGSVGSEQIHCSGIDIEVYSEQINRSRQAAQTRTARESRQI